MTYQVWSTTNLTLPFAAFGGVLTASAPVLMVTNRTTNTGRFFKVQLFP